MAKQHPECPSCTCGKVEVSWSDRGPCHIDPDDHNEVVETTLCCVLDHCYDRTVDGVPDGMPDELSKLLAPAISEWLTPRFTEWHNKTVSLKDGEKAEFKTHLMAAIARPASSEEETC